MGKSLGLFLLALCSFGGKVFTADDWWEYGHFYQIYPRSFKDSDGDGIGDINGITSQLSHLKYIGVTGVWLSPIFQSPMKDFGYDISDFTKIQKEYGTMDDFEKLIARCKELDIKLILDFVPNHCSSEHEWFQKAINPDHPEHSKYKDYFIWHKGKLLDNGTRVPPSNWLSIFRGSAWEWVDKLEAYFLHQFLEEQPDLNYRNQGVVDDMKEVLRFWLRKGVAGFRIDAVPFIYETEENEHGWYDDEPLSGECSDDPVASCYLNHTQTKDLDETYEMIYQWRRVIDEEEFTDYTKILMTEGYTSLPNTLRYYGKIENGSVVEGQYGAQIPFNFLMLERTWMGTGTSGHKIVIDDWLDNLPKGNKIQANWVLGNHDTRRLASKYKPRRTDLFNIYLKTLPGIAVTYYGEEIGMTDVWISWEDTVDPQACRSSPETYESHTRDPERTPMQWDSSKNSGFSSATTTWLPLALNYTESNVDLQLSQSRSHLKVFRQLMQLRETRVLKYGELELKPVDEEVLVYKRAVKDDPKENIVVVVLNLGTNYKKVDLTTHLSKIPKKLKVVIASVHAEGLKPGDVINSKKVPVSPDVGLVLVGKN